MENPELLCRSWLENQVLGHSGRAKQELLVARGGRLSLQKHEMEKKRQKILKLEWSCLEEIVQSTDLGCDENLKPGG